MAKTVRRSVPYQPEPVYNYQKCSYCGLAVKPEDLVARPIDGDLYFGHRACFKGKTDLQIAKVQQVTMEVE